MRLFDNYLNGLNDLLSKSDGAARLINESRFFSDNLKKGIEETDIPKRSAVNNATEIEGPKVVFNYDKTYLAKYYGNNSDSFDTITIGPHPDFNDLSFNSRLYHHCVSVFIDIKGSTRLIEKYPLEVVRMMKDSILTLAIHVSNQFGGHVHRLQGDGIFLQFVRKNKNKNDAIINALNATSILTQFVSVDLAQIFKQYEIKPIRIRTGIDFGDDDKVLWSYYGIPNCKELTTTSLHTDMAAKLQAKASDNSILIGDNVKKALDLKEAFWSYFNTSENELNHGNFPTNLDYPFYIFNWRDFLISLPFVGKKSTGNELELKNPNYFIECYISDEGGVNSERYYPNSKSIPKGKVITYKLMRGNSQYVKQPFEKIEWHAFNSGEEATSNNQLNHDFGKKYNNKNYCETGAAYLGHHIVECKIIREHSSNEKISFPIFVQ